MFVSYALTLICSVMPCTHVIYTNTPVQITVDSLHGPQIEDPWIRITTSSKDNIVTRNVSYTVSDNSFDHLLIPPGDDPNVGHIPTSELEQPAISLEDAQNNYLDTAAEPQNPVVQIHDGGLKGFIMKTITGRQFASYQGIPFAQPPVGPLRFKAPVKNLPWEGTRDAFAESPTCIQTDYIQQYKIHGQEDCLYLNVFTPQISKSRQDRKIGNLLPVMVFIHGGGWFFGSSSLYGPAYMMDQDVVLVSVNYRLGLFGFLSTGDKVSPGNNGLKDQSLALKWVQENIAAFGGDPSRVTIFGESAGAGSVHFHMLSPLSRGLFHGAISQSGCATCFWSISERAVETTRKYSSLFNCTGNSEQIISCLQEKDANTLVGGQLYLLQWTMYPVVIFGPVIEPSHPGAFLDELPESIYKKKAVAQVPWISGFNADEGAINIAVLFLANTTVPQLNTQWEKYGPIFLELTKSETDPVELSQRIRNHYLGNDSIQYENRAETIKMFSDRYVVACGVKGIRMHAEYSSMPVYAYNLAFRGKYSTVQLLGQNAKDWGVSHLDDLIYLFNNTAYYPTLNLKDEEYQMAKVMTDIWANFAKTGKPLITTSNNKLEDRWTPVSKSVAPDSPIAFMELTREPRMIQDPYHARVQFWKGLRLVD